MEVVDESSSGARLGACETRADLVRPWSDVPGRYLPHLAGLLMFRTLHTLP